MRNIRTAKDMSKNIYETRIALMEQKIDSINAKLEEHKAHFIHIRDAVDKTHKLIIDNNEKIDTKIDKVRDEFYAFNKWLIGIVISLIGALIGICTFFIKFVE